ncbi:zinc finger protein 723-like [Nannospalax galili]|uniref:zinc finger protein 723-like n=1 Tax=Nannospalax galili TaxID=1026970 RepID=UPI00111C493D|nr:zinc finger protein 723-like [Nannospalax galili]
MWGESGRDRQVGGESGLTAAAGKTPGHVIGVAGTLCIQSWGLGTEAESIVVYRCVFDFSQEKCEFLDSAQRSLYTEMMLENYNRLVSIRNSFQHLYTDLTEIKLAKAFFCWGIHAGEKPYKCEECKCDMSFTQYLRVITEFILQKYPTYVENVTKCGRSLTLRSTSSHYRIHTGVKRYRSEEHDKSFTQATHLQNHKSIHNGEKHYKCEEWAKSFTQNSKLRTQRNPTNVKNVTCAFFECHLRIYQAVHSGEKTYRCKECDKCFIHYSNLRHHKKIHPRKKPYKYEECDRSFTSSSTLKNHYRVHSGEEHDRYEECDKFFTQPPHLRSHESIHTGEKTHRCEGCDKSFTTCSSLTAHYRIHTGGKSYRCEACGKSFTSLSHLRFYQRIHTGEKPYK